MRELHIDLADVVMGMTDDPAMATWYLDLETGETLRISEEDAFDLDDEQEEEAEADRPEWQKTEDYKEYERTVRLVLAGDPRWEEIPHIETHEAYDRMRRFADSIDDEHLAERLYDALEGRGAFSRFRRALQERGLLQPWYDFKDAEEEREAIRWLESIGIRPAPARKP